MGRMAYVASCNFLMAQFRVKVIRDSGLEPLKIHVNEERVTAGLYSRKRGREDIRQRGPVEPVFADRDWLERQSKTNVGVSLRVS